MFIQDSMSFSQESMLRFFITRHTDAQLQSLKSKLHHDPLKKLSPDLIRCIAGFLLIPERSHWRATNRTNRQLFPADGKEELGELVATRLEQLLKKNITTSSFYYSCGNCHTRFYSRGNLLYVQCSQKNSVSRHAMKTDLLFSTEVIDGTSFDIAQYEESERKKESELKEKREPSLRSLRPSVKIVEKVKIVKNKRTVITLVQQPGKLDVALHRCAIREIAFCGEIRVCVVDKESGPGVKEILFLRKKSIKILRMPPIDSDRAPFRVRVHGNVLVYFNKKYLGLHHIPSNQEIIPSGNPTIDPWFFYPSEKSLINYLNRNDSSYMAEIEDIIMTSKRIIILFSLKIDRIEIRDYFIEVLNVNGKFMRALKIAQILGEHFFPLRMKRIEYTNVVVILGETDNVGGPEIQHAFKIVDLASHFFKYVPFPREYVQYFGFNDFHLNVNHVGKKDSQSFILAKENVHR